MADVQLDHLNPDEPRASAAGRRGPGPVAFARLLLRAALPFVAAGLVSASSLEPHLAPRAPDPILFEDQAPPAPRRVPKSDPDPGHSLALLPA